MPMPARSLGVLVAAVFLATLSNAAGAAMPSFGAANSDAASAQYAAPADHTTIAQNAKKTKGGNKKKKCENISKYCKYSAEGGQQKRWCTPENIKFMEEKC